MGPLVVVVLLKVSNGDQWTMADLVIPWNVSVGLTALGLIPAFFMSDRWCLPDDKMGKITKKQHVGRVERRALCFRTKHVPIICLVVDILAGLASGMSIKFFPIW
jgi:hypothetical protein